MAHHALVFGASGILGWAVVNEILSNYPEKGTYAKVTALTNRPLSLEESLWPTPGPETPQLSLLSGIDLTHGTTDDFVQTLKERVPDIATVDHVFYFAYKFDPDFPTETAINLQMLRRSFDALDALAPKMSYVIFPTGTKGYGIHLPSRPHPAPFSETLHPTLPPAARASLFYYPLRDELTLRSRHAPWSFAELRIDMVVGYVPHSSPYNLAGTLGNYLSLYRFMHERGHPDAASRKVPYPSPAPSFRILNNEGNAGVFARAGVWMCLHPERAGEGELYNVGGEARAATYEERWGAMAGLFGLEGGGPGEVEGGGPVGFVRVHGGEVEAMAREKGVRLQGVENEEGFDAWMRVFDFDHHFELGKLRAVGFKEEVGSGELWGEVVGMYARAGRFYLGNGEA